MSEREIELHRDALASLWKAQLLRSRRPAVKTGRRLHGEYVGAELEDYDECTLVEMGAKGLIDPVEYEEQLERLERATDPISYFRSEEWPLFRYPAEGFEILGVPDDITRGRDGYIVVEMKTTRSPKRFLRGPGYQGALHQLAAYYLAVGYRWRVEAALLIIVDQKTRRTIHQERIEEERLRKLAGEALEVARRIASLNPPSRPEGRDRCRFCEYNAEPAACTMLV